MVIIPKELGCTPQHSGRFPKPLGEGQAQGWGVCGNLYLCNVHLTVVYLCRPVSLQHTHHCSMRMPLSDVLN